MTENSNTSTTLVYGYVTFKRVISDGDHGNLQIERSVPVLVDTQPNQPITPEMIQAAETDAWAKAVGQTVDQINRQFEREDKPAPIYLGPRYNVVIWRPEPSIVLIIPYSASDLVPGGCDYQNAYKAHRLEKAYEIADRAVEQNQHLRDMWDFSDGDFTDLQEILDTSSPANTQQNRQNRPMATSFQRASTKQKSQ